MRPTFASGVGLVTVGSMTANIAAYGLHTVASRWLAPAGYSSFAVLLTMGLLLTVPALGVQAVIARELIRGHSLASAKSLTLRITWWSVALSAATVPIMVPLRLPIGATIAAVAVAPSSVVIAAACAVAQAAAHHRRLAALFGAQGLVKSVPPVMVLACGGGQSAAFTSSAVAMAVLAALCWPALGPRSEAGLRVLDVVRASQVQLALLCLAGLDVLAARDVLSAAESGRYALGAVATKAALWLPAAVAVVAYPQLADAARSRRVLVDAVRLLAALAVVEALLAAVAGPFAGTVVGADYQPIAQWLWLFALVGGALSVLQVALVASLAARRTAVGVIAWAAIACEIGGIGLFGHTPVSVLIVTATCVGVATASAAATAYLLTEPSGTSR